MVHAARKEFLAHGGSEQHLHYDSFDFAPGRAPADVPEVETASPIHQKTLDASRAHTRPGRNPDRFRRVGWISEA